MITNHGILLIHTKKLKALWTASFLDLKGYEVHRHEITLIFTEKREFYHAFFTSQSTSSKQNTPVDVNVRTHPCPSRKISCEDPTIREVC